MFCCIIVKQWCGEKKLIKVGLAILKELRMTGLLKGCMWECVGSRIVVRPQKRWNDFVDFVKKQSFERWVSKRAGA